MSRSSLGDRVRVWWADRFPLSGDRLAELTNEPVPNHLKRWWFALGGTPAYLFVVQIVTGILLAFYYQPSTSTAYESVRTITDDVAFGWYIRSLHRWGATLMIAAVVLHELRVFFTGAYRRPRELNWLVGMSLLVCSLTLGFTGYSLVYEQLSYWGATVRADVAASIPGIGDGLRTFLLGGDEYGTATLPRFYVLHAAILPGTLIALLFLHIVIIRLHGVAPLEFEGERAEQGKRTFKFFPDHFYTELIIGLVLMLVLSALATAWPMTMGPHADPLTTPEIIKPEWFFYVAFRWLKLFSGTAAVLSMGFVLFTMFAWPFIDAAIRRRWPSSEASVWIGVAAVAAILGLTLWEAVVAH